MLRSDYINKAAHQLRQEGKLKGARGILLPLARQLQADGCHPRPCPAATQPHWNPSDTGQAGIRVLGGVLEF